MEALRQEPPPFSINDLPPELAADVPNHIFGPEANLPGAAAVPYPPEFAVSAGLPEAQLSQPAAISDEIAPRERLATTLGPRAVSLKGDWLRSIVFGSVSSENETLVAHGKETLEAAANDLQGTDEGTSDTDADPEAEDKVIDTKNSSEEFQKFGSGGGGKKDCFGCGRRTRERECSHCTQQKQAPKPQARKRGEHSDGAGTAANTRLREAEADHSRPKEGVTGTWLAKLALAK